MNKSFQNLSSEILEGSLRTLTHVSFPTQSIAFPVVQDSLVNSY